MMLRSKKGQIETYPRTQIETRLNNSNFKQAQKLQFLQLKLWKKKKKKIKHWLQKVN